MEYAGSDLYQLTWDYMVPVYAFLSTRLNEMPLFNTFYWLIHGGLWVDMWHSLEAFSLVTSSFDPMLHGGSIPHIEAPLEFIHTFAWHGMMTWCFWILFIDEWLDSLVHTPLLHEERLCTFPHMWTNFDTWHTVLKVVWENWWRFQPFRRLAPSLGRPLEAASMSSTPTFGDLGPSYADVD